MTADNATRSRNSHNCNNGDALFVYLRTEIQRRPRDRILIDKSAAGSPKTLHKRICGQSAATARTVDMNEVAADRA
ncbi:unnamed protein product [Macrosiphum euphorbiae]|uniref:Uncharacterized protein n=1 Tax=Macrosiphum euphorbiae TaxID=13131 RepID=A0AAV0WG22_9HEMI|nr:unnamed protein product [Macrosiphum euphorbiae]